MSILGIDPKDIEQKGEQLEDHGIQELEAMLQRVGAGLLADLQKVGTGLVADLERVFDERSLTFRREPK